MRTLGKQTVFTALWLVFGVQAIYAVNVAEIRCDYKVNPVGVGLAPRFSWVLAATQRNQVQSAYQVLVADDPALLGEDRGNCWDTGKVNSDQSLHVVYQGQPLRSGTHYTWKVRVWDGLGRPSAWSEPRHFLTALFHPRDWGGARWIGIEDINDAERLVPGVSPWGHPVKNLARRRPVVPLLRKEFELTQPVRSATLFICGLGQVQAFLNGQAVSEDFLSPGWTDYRNRCLYNTYDVTALVAPGQNALGALVGPGFYNVNNERYRKLLITYGMPKLIALLKVTFKDGSEKTIVSGPDWKACPSPITYSSIYGGESYDARREQPGWDRPGFNDRSWRTALLVKPPAGTLCPQITYPIRVRKSFAPKTVTKLAPDRWLYDFGQNVSGIVRIKVKGPRGRTIKVIPGELIHPDHTVNQSASGHPYYCEYTLKGTGLETWQPRFTYYGFRYAQIEGAVPADQTRDANLPTMVAAQLLHTFNNAPRVGRFHCSNELFNRIYELILSAIESNTQSVSTDCPHREKLGWLEQTYLMGSSIHDNFDIDSLYGQLIDNLQDAQHDNGLIPSIAPEYVHFGGAFTDSPEWGSAGIMVPWLVYRWYGDRSVVEKAWPMMQRYLHYLDSRVEGHILSYGLGDWYDLGPKPPGVAQLTPKGLTATATYYQDVRLMIKMARLLDKPEAAATLTQQAAAIKTAFNDHFFDPNTGLYATGSQTALAMPLCVGLVPPSDRRRVRQNLIDSIVKNHNALTAGDIGFHYLVQALTEAGASQLLFEMNNRDDVPGYGYQLKKGATALTESWTASDHASNDHLMLGHLMDWFFQGLCGIRQEADSVAYQHILIAPAYLKALTHAEASTQCPYGPIKSRWSRTASGWVVAVTIPVNTTAMIVLPTSDVQAVQESDTPLTDLDQVTWHIDPNQCLEVKVGSGSYRFRIQSQPKLK